MAAMPAEPADAGALPGAPADHAGAERVDHTGDLVPRDAREGEAGHVPFDRETVAVAHAACLDADTDLATRRLGHIALDEFKRAAGPRHLHCLHLCHRVLLVCERIQKLCRPARDATRSWRQSVEPVRVRVAATTRVGWNSIVSASIARTASRHCNRMGGVCQANG
jgi:hypothetical protein